MAELLIRKAKVDAPDKDYQTPLHIAAQNHRADIAQILIKAGAKVNNPRYDGATPLFLSARNADIDMVTLFLSAGAEVVKVNWDNQTPLHGAAENPVGCRAVAQLLIQADSGLSIDVRDSNGRYPLHVAARSGNAAMVSVLLKAGARHHVQDIEGQTALHLAASQGHVDAVALLLRSGADAFQLNKEGRTALDLAANTEFCADERAKTRHIAVVERLFATLWPGDQELRTTLHKAVWFKHKAATELLIQAGANVNLRTIKQWTPLHMAAFWGAAGIADLLIKAGADVSSQNDEGLTPADLARRNGYLKLATQLAELTKKVGASSRPK